MQQRKAPFPLLILGLLVIVGLPLVFFTFGWHAVDVACTRDEQQVTCHIAESFAAGIYVREDVAKGVTGIAYQTHQNRSSGTQGSRTVITSNLVFETLGGETKISSISSNTADDAKRELILKFRQWLDKNSSPRFEHHANMIDIFGWLGAIGVAFWAWVLLSWPYYLWKKRKALPQ